MRVSRTTVALVPFLVLLSLSIDAGALPLVQTHVDAEEGSSSSDIVWSTKRVRSGRDGTIWFAVSIGFAAPVEGALRGGFILLDTDRARGWDAKLYFQHWDNGSDADSCTLTIPDLGRQHAVRSRSGEQAVSCFLRKAALHASRRVRWFIRTAAIGQTMERIDRAPDRGWYG
jgi:hypothetical protein